MKYLIIILSLVACSKSEPAATIKPNIVIDGNSLAKGYLSSFGGYTKVFKDAGYNVTNVAIGGQTTLQMITNHADVDSAIKDNTILIVDEITNDLFYGATVDTALARVQRYIDERKKLHPNVKVIVVSPTPRSNAGTPPDFESKRQDVLLRMKGYIIAPVGSSFLGAANAQYDTLYYCDKVHHTDRGYIERGQIILNTIK